VQPWLGERVAAARRHRRHDRTSPDATKYRAPFIVVAAQTKDHAKSDAFLTALGKQLSQMGVNQTVQTETYRNIPLSYLTSSGTQDSSVAWATFNDNVVLTINPDNLKVVINAALDGQNLAAREGYKAVMSALPGQNAGAAYVDYNRYMDVLLQMTQSMQNSFDNITSNLDPQQAEAFKQQPEKMQRQQEAQLAQLRDMMKALGGTGATMSHEPTGIRFDTAMQ
jgi:hypothetical protein